MENRKGLENVIPLSTKFLRDKKRMRKLGFLGSMVRVQQRTIRTQEKPHQPKNKKSVFTSPETFLGFDFKVEGDGICEVKRNTDMQHEKLGSCGGRVGGRGVRWLWLAVGSE